MADEKQVIENQDEITEHEIKKPLLDAFKDLFKRPAALPGEIPSKHKTSNIDMRTSMSFREFRANIMKSVGNFFQSLSKLGSPKKEETLNKYAKEYVNGSAEKSTEKTKDDDTTVISQQPIHIPGQVSIQNARTVPVPTVAHINVDGTVVNEINKTKSEEVSFESDSSDGTIADTDVVQDVNQTPNPNVQNNVVIPETIVTSDPEKKGESKSKDDSRDL